MIPTGLVRSIVAWALDGTDEEQAAKLAQLKEERDRLVGGVVGTGKGLRSLTSGSIGAKTFAWQIDLTVTEKMEVITDVLTELGAAPAPAKLTYACFGGLQR